MTERERFRARLCHVLVEPWLKEMEVELVLVKSMRFLAHHPWTAGKRLRPVMFLLSYLTCRSERGLPLDVRGREVQLAAALELMHEASLVHDDLVDRTVLRRGKPSVQMTSGAGKALLMGDYMVFRALKMLLDVAESANDIRLARRLADSGLEIAHGQIWQLERYIDASSPEERMSMNDYIGVIGQKTAMFFAGGCEAGAALAGADDDTQRLFHDFGMELGLVFQMLDDLIDVIGDPDTAAKTLASNLDEGTVTLPFIHAWSLFPEDPGLKAMADARGVDAPTRAVTLELVRASEVLERCRATIAPRAARALDLLDALPSNLYRQGLLDLTDYICACSWGGMEPPLGPLSELRQAPKEQQMSTYDENLAKAREVMAAHKEALMARPEVTGLGIGAGDGGPDTFAIVVYLTARPADPLPEELDGMVVRGVFTDAFEAH